MKSRLAVSTCDRGHVVAACSSGVGSHRRPQPGADCPAASATPLRFVRSRRRCRTHGLRRRVAEGRPRAGHDRLRGREPGLTLTISTDSSSALETQIEQGAPADVFLSADTTNPQKLVDAGLADGAAVTFAGNKLTVIVPADNPAGIASPADLAKPGIKVIAAGDEVPITKYATQLVANLAKEPGYPADFVGRLRREHRLEGGQRQGRRRQDRARRRRRRDRLRDRRQGFDQGHARSTCPTPPTSRRPTPASSSRRRRTPTRPRVPDWFAGPEGQAILGGLGFLPPS